jgi:hypothetical protein
MTIAEQIYSLVKTLPQDQASEILTFAEYICTKNLVVGQPIDTEDAQVPWGELVSSLAGSWADDFPGGDDSGSVGTARGSDRFC